MKEDHAAPLNILLADDDLDDCLLFREALEELSVTANLATVHNGDQLMQLLTKSSYLLPDVLFLDLNMPRKNGFECLLEIKANEILKSIPVVIISTSFDQAIADQLYKNGAQHYICKPADFSQLKQAIHRSVDLVRENRPRPSKETFLLGHLKMILL